MLLGLGSLISLELIIVKELLTLPEALLSVMDSPILNFWYKKTLSLA